MSWFTLILSLLAAGREQAQVAPTPSESPGLQTGIGWGLEVRGTGGSFEDLHETYTFSTALVLAGNPEITGWERDWNEGGAELAASLDLSPTRWLVLCPELSLGSRWARFEARNFGQSFEESWRTEPGFLWGVGPCCEARPCTNAILQARCQVSEAKAEEDEEEIRSSKHREDPDARDAQFEWSHQRFTLAAGGSVGRATFLAGAAWRRFSLEKTLRYRIQGAERDPVASALNSERSRYAYENRPEWGPYAELGIDPSPHLRLTGWGILIQDLEAGAGLGFLW